MKTSVMSFLRGGVAVIEAEADIREACRGGLRVRQRIRPANREWNIRMKRYREAGPAARLGWVPATGWEFTQGPAAISECVRFERPGFWEHARRVEDPQLGFQRHGGAPR